MKEGGEKERDHAIQCNTYCNVFVLPKEAHANVVPEMGRFWKARGCDTILGQGYVKVFVVLHHSTSCENGLVCVCVCVQG